MAIYFAVQWEIKWIYHYLIIHTFPIAHDIYIQIFVKHTMSVLTFHTFYALCVIPIHSYIPNNFTKKCIAIESAKHLFFALQVVPKRKTRSYLFSRRNTWTKGGTEFSMIYISCLLYFCRDADASSSLWLDQDTPSECRPTGAEWSSADEYAWLHLVYATRYKNIRGELSSVGWIELRQRSFAIKYNIKNAYHVRYEPIYAY